MPPPALFFLKQHWAASFFPFQPWPLKDERIASLLRRFWLVFIFIPITKLSFLVLILIRSAAVSLGLFPVWIAGAPLPRCGRARVPRPPSGHRRDHSTPASQRGHGSWGVYIWGFTFQVGWLWCGIPGFYTKTCKRSSRPDLTMWTTQTA